MKPAADPLLRANDALREALRHFESPEAKLLPPAQYSALERRVLDLSRVVERLVLEPAARRTRGTSGADRANDYAMGRTDAAVPSPRPVGLSRN